MAVFSKIRCLYMMPHSVMKIVFCGFAYVENISSRGNETIHAALVTNTIARNQHAAVTRIGPIANARPLVTEHRLDLYIFE